MRDLISRGVRWVSSCFAVSAAAVVLWRGHSFEDSFGADMTVPVMCSLAALVFTLTGLSILAQHEEQDFQS
jgi:hypothetical protein